MPTLSEVLKAQGFAQNQLLYECLRDDDARRRFYGELKADGYPVVRFGSAMRAPGCARWPSEDVYLLSRADHVATALQKFSVEPYSNLDSEGRFMLGVDQPELHDQQHRKAWKALMVDGPVIAKVAHEAVRRACILPFKRPDFDLATDVAEAAALHFTALLFGLSARTRAYLQPAIEAAYTKLTYQIIGRHFSTDSGLPPETTDVEQLRQDVEDGVREACTAERDEFMAGLGVVPVVPRLYEEYRSNVEWTTMVALGLIAGTIGNIQASVCNTFSEFFRTDGAFEAARAAAREGDDVGLRALISDALLHNPGAPFLTRRADKEALGNLVPDGALVLLALGADPRKGELLFGGAGTDMAGQFPHDCVGRHLALPLVFETVKAVLLLPGLARQIDPDTNRPRPLEKRWGAACVSFPLQYERGRRLNQQPLFVVLPIAEPIGENAEKLRRLTEVGANIVEDALGGSRHVHFAWFSIVENGTHLAMTTVYDGDFDTYVEFFARDVPLFDDQFDYLAVKMPRPIQKYPKEFVEIIRRYNRAPLGNYFFSAYPLTDTATIRNADGGVQP